jgi:ferric-dicitrate binding protein FerR (iron transport regulator)
MSSKLEKLTNLNYAIIAVTVLLCIFLPEKHHVVEAQTQTAGYYVGRADVREFVLRDGTRCVLAEENDSAVSVSCGWKN